ncbi:MAG: hypothetical protein Q8R02_21825 [Hyphomonadaceae bacterium]|nr:hypothetical protein [Hyphomonadaceae bacterium]
MAAVTNEGLDRTEPETIDADYAPTDGVQDASNRSFAPAPMRSKAITLTQLLIASASASLLGAVMAIVATSANSGAFTGTLAREIDELARSQSEVVARTTQMSDDVVTLRSRLDSQAERLARQDQMEASIRAELNTVAGQLSELSGANGVAEPGTTAANTPLGVLLSRINRLESVIADDTAAPQTTRQVLRSVSDLQAQVEQLHLANTTLTAALNQRQASLIALESGLNSLSTDVAVVQDEAEAQRKRAASLGLLRKDTVVIQRSERTGPQPAMIQALSVLELAAQRGSPFLSEQQALATLLPADQDIASLDSLARQGAPTTEQLRREFDTAVRITGRIIGEPSDDGWNWLRASFDTATANTKAPAAELMLKARRSLDEGDLRSAAASIAALPQPALTAFATWRDQTVRRADLDDRLAVLNVRLMGATSAGTEG